MQYILLFGMFVGYFWFILQYFSLSWVKKNGIKSGNIKTIKHSLILQNVYIAEVVQWRYLLLGVACTIVYWESYL